MIKRVNTLERLGEVIVEGRPAKVEYGPGKGEKRAEALITYIPNRGSSYTARTKLPIRVELRRDNGETLMDITDPDGCTLRDLADFSADGRTLIDVTNSHGTVQDPFRYLRPQGAVALEPPANPPYELPNLLVRLEGNETVVIAPYFYD